jgi:hypothetical protein
VRSHHGLFTRFFLSPYHLPSYSSSSSHARRYKAQGAWGTGVNNIPDRIEFMNIAQDDALAYPRVVHRSYPSTVENAMESTVQPFMQKHVAIQETFFEIFDQLLGFPPGTLKKRHELDEPSSTESRNIRNPPIPEDGVMGLDAHTDFGSLVRVLSSFAAYSICVYNNVCG